MPETELRRLARAYFDGEISLDEFRTRRSAFIDGLIAGATGRRRPVGGMAASARAGRGHGSRPGLVRWGLLSISIGLVSIGAVALVLKLMPGALLPGDEPIAPQVIRTGVPEPALGRVDEDVGNRLIADFLERDQWDPDSLASLAGTWAELSEADRVGLRRSQDFMRLEEQLSQELYFRQVYKDRGIGGTIEKEEQALVALGESLGMALPTLETPLDSPQTPTTKEGDAVVEALALAGDEARDRAGEATADPEGRPATLDRPDSEAPTGAPDLAVEARAQAAASPPPVAQDLVHGEEATVTGTHPGLETGATAQASHMVQGPARDALVPEPPAATRSEPDGAAAAAPIPRNPDPEMTVAEATEQAAPQEAPLRPNSGPAPDAAPKEGAKPDPEVSAPPSPPEAHGPAQPSSPPSTPEPVSANETEPATATVPENTTIEQPLSDEPTEPAAEPQQSAAPAVQIRPQATTSAPRTNRKATCQPIEHRRPGRALPSCRDHLPAGLAGPELILVPKGAFTMGDDRHASEAPAHRVTIDYSFAVSRSEVSFAEYQMYCKAAGVPCPDNPWGQPDYPVVRVSANDAMGYARWLSQMTGATYRLPSEAEWEYVARAGTAGPYPFPQGMVQGFHAQYATTRPEATSHKTIQRNPFGLYHIVGNVREWVSDTWSPNHVGAPTTGAPRTDSDRSRAPVRGGAYSDQIDKLRASARLSLPRNAKDELTGFRVVRELSPAQ